MTTSFSSDSRLPNISFPAHPEVSGSWRNTGEIEWCCNRSRPCGDQFPFRGRGNSMTLRRTALWCVAGLAAIPGVAALIVALAVYRPALVRPWAERALTPRGGTATLAALKISLTPPTVVLSGLAIAGPPREGDSHAPGPPAIRADPRPFLPRRAVDPSRGSKGGDVRTPAPPGDGSPARPDGPHPPVRHRGPLADGRTDPPRDAPGSSFGRRVAIESGPGERRDARLRRIRGSVLPGKGKPPSSRRGFRPAAPSRPSPR